MNEPKINPAQAPLIKFCQSPDSFYKSDMDVTLKSQIRLNLVRNLAVNDRLNQIASDLGPGVPLIPMKGTYLDQFLYPPGIRQIGDIDLLLRLNDLPIVEEAVRGYGYQPCYKKVPRRVHLNLAGKLSYTHPQFAEIPIDIHWQLGPFPFLGRVPIELFWNQASRWADSLNLLTIKPEYLLLHLCLHLFSHIYDNWLVSCCDIAAVLHGWKNNVDWNRFIEVTGELGLSLPVLYSLEKAALLFNIVLPNSLLNEIRSIPVSDHNQAVYSKWMRLQRPGQRYLMEVTTTPNWIKRLVVPV